MHLGFFTTVFTQPLYNGLIFLLNYIPGADAGVAIIVFTIIVRLILYPFSRKSIETQAKMRQYEGELNQLKEKYKDNKQVQAEKMMAFYKEKGLNPLSGFLLLLIQIPIIYALYYIFLRSGLPVVKTDLLYSFVHAPSLVSMQFLGFADIAAKSYVLAALCAVTQYFQISLSIPNAKLPTGGKKGDFGNDLARSLSFQMKYFFPIMVFFISYSLSGTIALYWTTSNLFAIGQELYVRRQLKQKNA